MTRHSSAQSASRADVSSFPWDALPAVTKVQVSLARKLARIVPVPSDHEMGLLGEVADRLEEVAGTRHDIHFYRLEAHPSSEFEPDLGDYLVTSFHLPPSDARGVLAVDGSVVESWLEGMLDESPARPRQLGTIDPHDFGVVTYLLLRVVRLLVEKGAPPIALPSTPPRISAVSNALKEEPHIAELTFVVSNEESAGIMRIFMTASLIERLVSFTDGSFSRDRLARNLGRTTVGSIPVQISVSLGRVVLQDVERSMLRPGDVVLPTEHAFHWKGLDGKPEAARAYLPSSRSWLPCTIEAGDPAKNESWRVKLTGVEPTIPEFEENEMSDDVYSGNEMTDAATMALQTHANVTLEVRLGSATLNITELSSLQSGQVLELDRKVGDPVELVVNNSVIGRGELVNIEGKLGVRVLSLASR